MRESGTTGQGIALLTDDAPRKVRQYLLYCRNDMMAANFGCRMTILGHATLCEKSFMGMSTTEEPCLAVEDNWNVSRPQ
jgi:hypothetical protein